MINLVNVQEVTRVADLEAKIQPKVDYQLYDCKWNACRSGMPTKISNLDLDLDDI